MFRRIFAVTPTMAIPVAVRMQSQQGGNFRQGGGNNNFRQGGGGGGNFRQQGAAGGQDLMQGNRMPPAFDIIKSNEDHVDEGYMMRVQYINTNVVLNYMKQKKSNEELRKEDSPTSAEGGENKDASSSNNNTRRHTKGQKYERDGVTTMLLPALYAARVLSVLEGEQEKCDLVHRYSSGTFGQSTTDNNFTLNVKTVVNGKENDPVNWTCEFDPANALMFRRFLVQVLHQNAGF